MVFQGYIVKNICDSSHFNNQPKRRPVMIIGVFGDTHDCDDNDIKAVVDEEFIPRGVKVIIHTGDIQNCHVNPDLYGGLPVICVLTKDQAFDPDFSLSPDQWRFVRPAYHQDPPRVAGHFTDALANQEFREWEEYFHCQRIYCRLVPILDGEKRLVVYCGHERSFDALINPQRVSDFFNLINQVHDGTRLAVTGHTHHQFIYRRGDFTWVNPGAMVDSWSKTKEFAIIDTANWEVVLGRLSNLEAKIEPVTVGIVSDTGNVDNLDRGFWRRLAGEFNKRGVTHVICCGNFLPIDIGRSELAHLQVYYYLLPDFIDCNDKPDNWHLLTAKKPVAEIGGHWFYVQHGIGPEYANFSEIESHKAFGELLNPYKHLDYVVAGLVPGTILQETETYSFINPGDARDHKYFATVCLPRGEFTASTVSENI